MKKLTGSIIGLPFLRINSVVIDTAHGLIHFPHFTMQVKTASSESNSKNQPVTTDGTLVIPLRTTKTITVFLDHPSEWNPTGTVTPLEKFAETASLLIAQPLSTNFDKRTTVRVNKTTESPYLIKKNTPIGVLRSYSGQFKHIKPKYMAILSMIPQKHPYLTAYLNQSLRTSKPEQQNNTFLFPTPEKNGKPEDHTPKQTRVLRELIELKKKKTSIHKRAQNPERSSSNVLIELTHS